jgi:Domain of unknown function (DUF4260)
MSGIPTYVLRGEGLLVLVAATCAYSLTAISWWMFAMLFLVPDMFMLGYLRNNKIGSIIYNIGHTYILPGGLLLAAQLSAQPMLMALSLIWIAHIGFDRVLGYGLKYANGFKSTHLSPSN